MLGPRLWAVVEEAGLRPLGMIGVQPHFGPGDEVGIAYFVESMRLAEPLIVGTEWPLPRRSAWRRLSNG
jgi:hypothetical protein